MEIREFFRKTNHICRLNHGEECPKCLLNDYCCDGIFAADEKDVEELIKIVEENQEGLEEDQNGWNEEAAS